MQVSRVLRKSTTGFMFWCPGCDEPHHVRVAEHHRNEDGNWGFDGNLERPTFTPSVRVYWPQTATRGEVTRCHSFVRDGEIEFLGDCLHGLAGKTVPLGDLPGGDEFGWGD